MPEIIFGVHSAIEHLRARDIENYGLSALLVLLS